MEKGKMVLKGGVRDKNGHQKASFTYNADRVVGNGSFGIVF